MGDLKLTLPLVLLYIYAYTQYVLFTHSKQQSILAILSLYSCYIVYSNIQHSIYVCIISSLGTIRYCYATYSYTLLVYISLVLAVLQSADKVIIQCVYSKIMFYPIQGKLLLSYCMRDYGCSEVGSRCRYRGGGGRGEGEWKNLRIISTKYGCLGGSL